MERLNKYLANTGVGSRHYCDDLILHGRVTVDGQTVHEAGARVDPTYQQVCVDGQPIQAEPLVYWLVNKPRGYVCTNYDPAGRPRAIDLIDDPKERVYTVGRLDEDSQGLLLMTNNGDLAHKLMHPRFGIAKTYLVQVAGKLGRQDVEKLLEGVWLPDGHVKAKRVKRLRIKGESTWLEIVLTEGKNREIPRMLVKLEYEVLRLKRTAIGPLTLHELDEGKSRRLGQDEVEMLRQLVTPRPSQKRAPEQKSKSAIDEILGVGESRRAAAHEPPAGHNRIRVPYPPKQKDPTEGRPDDGKVGPTSPIELAELVKAEGIADDIQAAGTRLVERVISDLVGRRGATAQENREIAKRVRKLAERFGLQLLYKGQPTYLVWNKDAFEARSTNSSREYLGGDADFLPLTVLAKGANPEQAPPGSPAETADAGSVQGLGKKRTPV